MCLVCPYEFDCPTCRQPPGSPCRRPSGHDCAAHVDRVLLADRKAISEHWDTVLATLGGPAAVRWRTQLGSPDGKHVAPLTLTASTDR